MQMLWILVLVRHATQVFPFRSRSQLGLLILSFLPSSRVWKKPAALSSLALLPLTPPWELLLSPDVDRKWGIVFLQRDAYSPFYCIEFYYKSTQSHSWGTRNSKYGEVIRLKIIFVNCQRHYSWFLVPVHDWPLRRPGRAIHHLVLRLPGF